MPSTRLIATIAVAASLLAACSPAGDSGDPTRVAVHAPSPGVASSSTTPSSPPVLPGSLPAGTKPPVVTNGPRVGNAVALTFDADMTDYMKQQLATGKIASYANLKILDILEQGHIPATFFLTGMWVEQYPQVTRRITGNPLFEVGNHTYKHSSFTPNCYSLAQLPAAEMTSDVAHTFDIITPYGGRQTRYFRFPGGCYDDAALRALAPLGVTVIQWDVVSGDPFATAAAPIVRAVLTQVKPGSIVVMHITEGNAQYTDEALPQILSGLAGKGLHPVALSELLHQQ